MYIYIYVYVYVYIYIERGREGDIEQFISLYVSYTICYIMYRMSCPAAERISCTLQQPRLIPNSHKTNTRVEYYRGHDDKARTRLVQ